ncbi:MAG: DUF87 domain-containing protein [Mesorhizobium sp.]
MIDNSFGLPDASAGVSATSVGEVLSVRGSEARIGLPIPAATVDQRTTVGKFLTISAGSNTIVGMITEVSGGSADQLHLSNYKSIARIDLVGEIRRNADGSSQFKRGVREYPAIGDAARIVSGEELRLIYAPSDSRAISIGQLNQDATIPAYVDVDSLLTKHFAVLGSTGVGKSSGVAVILGELMKARPNMRVLLLDCHSEYGKCFGDKANVVSARNLRLPFWLFNFEEITDVVFGGRPVVPEQAEILAELIPMAKGAYANSRAAATRSTLKRKDPRIAGFTVDTPVPYLLQDLLSLIDERMGKLENRSSRMTYNRLMLRIESIRNDPRYAFMFERANVGGDTMAALLSELFGLESPERPITILQLASLPVEVVDAVVCVVSRLAFDFGLWSDGTMPLLLVCEEAHRYASADYSLGFGPARRALSRIAKEGRKYGVCLGLVTQRPAELDPTIISQCSTLFAMRMANDQDQTLLRSAVSDAAADLLAFIPSLGTGEVVGFGEAVPLPTRLTFKELPEKLVPRSDSASPQRDETANMSRFDYIRSVVDRWRDATTNRSAWMEDVPTALETPQLESENPNESPADSPAMESREVPSSAGSRRIEEARYRLLQR